MGKGGMFTRQTTRILHEEHMAVINLLDRLDSVLRGRGTMATPVSMDSTMGTLLGDLAVALEGEVTGHFTFEENDLFPLLADAGEGALGEALTEEHAVIVPVARRVATLARTARADGFTDETWSAFRRLGAELIERLGDHARKEEMGFLPALEDVLDEEQDKVLWGNYAAGR